MATNIKKVKRKPTPPKKASKGKNDASTSKGAANDKKNKNTTVYNSSQDNSLATKDAYSVDFNQGTLNSLYKFANTLNLDLNKLSEKLRGGKDMLKQVSGYLKQANEIKNNIKERKFLDAIGGLAPGAKAALANAGIDVKKVDTIIEGAKLAIKVGEDVKKIKNGDLSVLNGLNDLTRHITGYELINVQDVMAVKEAATEVMKEFSSLGLEIGAEFKKLVKSEKHGWDIATDVTSEIIHDLSNNGDYNTMFYAIELSDPQRMEQISGKVVEKMISEFSFNAVFNKEKDRNVIFDELMKVIYAFRGGEVLWIDRPGMRKIFNLKLFLNASNDFKTLIKTVLSTRYYLNPEDVTNKVASRKSLIRYDYSNKTNEVLMLLSNVFTKTKTDFSVEFTRDHSEFIINGVQRTDQLVSPSDFKANILAK